MDTSGKGLVSRLTSWAMHPLGNQLDFMDTVLAVVLVTTVAVAWWQVMRHIQEGQ